MRRLLAACLLWGLAALPAAAQNITADPAPAIAIVDSERLYADSRYGRQIRAEIEQQATALAAENERIVAQLTEEEQSLTERRPGMTPEAFRAEAEAFDIKVQDIRRARDAKEAELQQERANGRVRFFEEVRPLLGQLMIARGATALLDSRTVVVAVRAADITDTAIAEIDATFVDATVSEDGQDAD